jgi:hypothetical protein
MILIPYYSNRTWSNKKLFKKFGYDFYFERYYKNGHRWTPIVFLNLKKYKCEKKKVNQ